MDEVNFNQIVGSHDILLVTLDTLRFDVAQGEFQNGGLPHLSPYLGPNGWDRRHSPGSFTFAAHQAFFAGFLPTPFEPENALTPRLFAAQFEGSATTTTNTWVYQQADVVSALSARGYHTFCIGGVGFFNLKNELSRVLPGLFSEAHWNPEFGVTHPESTQNQVDHALKRLAATPSEQNIFLFLNVSALHQPNNIFSDPNQPDSAVSQAAALRYAEVHLVRLIQAMVQRNPVFVILCSDHGTAYGEDGYTGHRLAHPVVWDVPYRHFVVESP